MNSHEVCRLQRPHQNASIIPITFFTHERSHRGLKLIPEYTLDVHRQMRAEIVAIGHLDYSLQSVKSCTFSPISYKY